MLPKMTKTYINRRHQKRHPPARWFEQPVLTWIRSAPNSFLHRALMVENKNKPIKYHIFLWIDQNSFCWNKNFKGCSDSNHFIFEINIGKRWIWHRTTLNLNDAIFNRFRVNFKFNFRVVLSRIRLFPTLISMIKWLGSELPLNFELRTGCSADQQIGRQPRTGYRQPLDKSSLPP